VDYYFFYGPEADQIIHQYRQLTGHAPLFAKWASGFFQSKDRYQSQDELLGVIDNYRSHNIPVDAIVQDWFWWTKQGSSSFSPQYPDMLKTIGTLHERYHAHIMISIWPTFDPDAKIAQEMAENNFLIPGTFTYDATNPSARDLYWKMLAGKLFSLGTDAFWLDSTEPEQPGANQSIQPGSNLFLGQSALYSNVFPFMHTLGIYENWRKATEQKRVFLLTRSAFAGSQHNAAATWSGDVYSTFWAFSRQIPAGLNFALSGLPYWTTDIGGYGHPSYKSTEDPLFQELYTRWFEYGTFCPIFRTHGHRANNRNELTAFGKTTPTLILYDRLRYRMLPYIYSLAWRVTNDDYTIMRPLVMDWRQDGQVRDLGDEFMFGPALLVAPVIKAGATSRPVYLPHAVRWYDFWTGEAVSEGSHISSAPIERIPLYLRAGAILPLGPDVEYAAQMPDDPIEVRIYPGANGNFNLYEDAGDTYQYEKGAHSIIPFQWDDKTRRLTIGAREGVYSGMLAKRHFMIVLVGRNHGVGPRVTKSIDRQVEYSGRPVEVQMNGKGSDISGMQRGQL
jgi:alpha-D-xyloside xylohydrolase